MEILVILKSPAGSSRELADSDINVLSQALTLKEMTHGTVHVLLFAGRESDRTDLLRKVCSYRVDDAVLVRLPGSAAPEDPAVIAGTIRAHFPNWDLLLFGRIASCGDAVDPAVQTAGYLGRPVISYCEEILSAGGGRLLCRKTCGGEVLTLEAKLPCVVHSLGEAARFTPTIADIVAAFSGGPIRELEAPAPAGGPSRIVLTGEHPFGTYGQRRNEMLTGDSDRQLAEALVRTLARLGFRPER